MMLLRRWIGQEPGWLLGAVALLLVMLAILVGLLVGLVPPGMGASLVTWGLWAAIVGLLWWGRRWERQRRRAEMAARLREALRGRR